MDLKRKKKARENKGGLTSLMNNINKRKLNSGYGLDIVCTKKIAKTPVNNRMAVPRWREDKMRLFSPRITI